LRAARPATPPAVPLSPPVATLPRPPCATAAPLPSLTALRAFEAAARHLSVTRAAAELHVTQTAVSHQIKHLEAELGVPLFRREARGLALTRDGDAWARELGEVFARLRDANTRLRARPAARTPTVAVSVIPSFGARWLVPRLGRFLAKHPGIDVTISASERLVDFVAEPVDVGVRYGMGDYPGLITHKLADDAFLVVCAPSLRRRLSSPSDLRRHTLLHDDEPNAWRTWLARNGVRGVDAARGTVITDSSMLVAAAVQGQGVALARRSLALDDLTAGRLVQPFPRVRPLPTGRAYYLVSPRANLARPEVAAFRAWLVDEAATLR
jgi:LysR family transcriptional regulator, glycine cleavage system transcriptional activator